MMGNLARSDGEQPLSTKPYLIRAIYQWALDNSYTPQILVDTDDDEVVIPKKYIQNNRIALNIHPQAVTGLELGDEYVWLSARFSGKAMEITVPISAVMAIYARENGQGIVFQDNNSGIISPPPDSPVSRPSPKKNSSKKPKKQNPSHLKLVE